jgi:hypothetical protein
MGMEKSVDKCKRSRKHLHKKKRIKQLLWWKKDAVVYYSAGDYNNTGEGVMRF